MAEQVRESITAGNKRNSVSNFSRKRDGYLGLRKKETEYFQMLLVSEKTRIRQKLNW